MRINKFVARATGMARRKVDDLIDSGQITVNDKSARIGQQIDETDVVKLAGKPLSIPKYTYLALNKPVGYVCSRQNQKGDKTIYELLPSQYRSLKLVGRLDKNSSGIILLTDDGDFAHKMLHPSFKKAKQYDVELDKPLAKTDIKQIEEGVLLEDGLSRLKIVSCQENSAIISMDEGRNRQIRRTFAALGYEVIKLHRTNFGDYSLDKLKTGEYQIFDVLK